VGPRAHLDMVAKTNPIIALARNWKPSHPACSPVSRVSELVGVGQHKAIFLISKWAEWLSLVLITGTAS